MSTDDDITVRLEDPAQPDIIALLRNSEANSASLYPAESIHHLSVDALRTPEVRFLVARDGAGRALATGAAVLHGDWAEIKRMWVEADARGRGLSRLVLTALIDLARAAGTQVLRLETGVRNDVAVALYERAGFRHRGPFEGYSADPLSIFMERRV